MPDREYRTWRRQNLETAASLPEYIRRRSRMGQDVKELFDQALEYSLTLDRPLQYADSLADVMVTVNPNISETLDAICKQNSTELDLHLFIFNFLNQVVPAFVENEVLKPGQSALVWKKHSYVAYQIHRKNLRIRAPCGIPYHWSFPNNYRVQTRNTEHHVTIPFKLKEHEPEEELRNVIGIELRVTPEEANNLVNKLQKKYFSVNSLDPKHARREGLTIRVLNAEALRKDFTERLKQESCYHTYRSLSRCARAAVKSELELNGKELRGKTSWLARRFLEENSELIESKGEGTGIKHIITDLAAASQAMKQIIHATGEYKRFKELKEAPLKLEQYPVPNNTLVKDTDLFAEKVSELEVKDPETLLEKKQALIEHYLPLVIDIAQNEFVEGGIPYEELVSAGSQALVETIMERTVINPGGIIREVKNTIRTAIQTENAYEAVHKARVETGFEDIAVNSFVEQNLLNDELTETINRVLNERLNLRTREILRLRYGLGDGATHTLEEVGAEFLISRNRVRLIEIQAIGRLLFFPYRNVLEALLPLHNQIRYDEIRKRPSTWLWKLGNIKDGNIAIPPEYIENGIDQACEMLEKVETLDKTTSDFSDKAYEDILHNAFPEIPVEALPVLVEKLRE